VAEPECDIDIVEVLSVLNVHNIISISTNLPLGEMENMNIYTR